MAVKSVSTRIPSCAHFLAVHLYSSQWKHLCPLLFTLPDTYLILPPSFFSPLCWFCFHNFQDMRKEMIISVSLMRHPKSRRQRSYLIGDRDTAATHSGVLSSGHRGMPWQSGSSLALLNLAWSGPFIILGIPTECEPWGLEVDWVWGLSLLVNSQVWWHNSLDSCVRTKHHGPLRPLSFSLINSPFYLSIRASLQGTSSL